MTIKNSRGRRDIHVEQPAAAPLKVPTVSGIFSIFDASFSNPLLRTIPTLGPSALAEKSNLSTTVSLA